MSLIENVTENRKVMIDIAIGYYVLCGKKECQNPQQLSSKLRKLMNKGQTLWFHLYNFHLKIRMKNFQSEEAKNLR
jgi:hypothetical protein